MLQKLFFLVSLLGLNHAGWYTNGNGYTLGLCIAAAVALVAVIVFYYIWGKLRPLTEGHYYITGIGAAIVSLGIVFLVARKMLIDYIVAADLTSIDPSLLAQIKTGTFDMWLFATNSAIWCFVIYFIFSIVLKNWSPYFYIPFGRLNKIKRIK